MSNLSCGIEQLLIELGQDLGFDDCMIEIVSKPIHEFKVTGAMLQRGQRGWGERGQNNVFPLNETLCVVSR